MKTLIVIVGVIFLAVLSFRLIDKKDVTSEFERILKKIKFKYGREIARNVELIYMLETARLTSSQFLKTYSAGMMAFSANFPYGWNTLFTVFWSQPQGIKYKPLGVVKEYENKGLLNDGGGVKGFLKFKDLESAMFTLAAFLKHYDNNAGRWFSLKPDRQKEYVNALQKITPIFT